MKKLLILGAAVFLVAAACNKTTTTNPPPTAPLGTSPQSRTTVTQPYAQEPSPVPAPAANSKGQVLGETYVPPRSSSSANTMRNYNPGHSSAGNYAPGTLGAAGSGQSTVTTLPPQTTVPTPNTRTSIIYLFAGQSTTDNTGQLNITATNIYGGQANLQIGQNYNGQTINLSIGQSTSVNGFTLTLVAVNGSQAQISITH